MINRPRRVLLAQTQYENAGAQEISRLIAADLVARGYETRQLFFFRRSMPEADAADLEFCATERPGRPLAFVRFMLALRRAIRRFRPDVVVTFQHFGNVIGAPMARFAGARRVIANQVSTSASMSPLVIAADRLLGRFGFYDRIVVNSEKTERTYDNYPATYRSRLLRIDHGFQDKTVAISKADARAALNLPPDGPLLGCAARLHPLKQVDRAIATLPLLPDARLALAGEGQDRERLEASAHALGVADRVIFLGELAPTRIGVFLAALDCFVFPSAAETFGLAPVEAAQAGVPVVANRLPVLEEVLAIDGESCAIFVDALDPADFAAGIRRALDEPETARRLIDVGRKLQRRYPLSGMTQAYADLIASMIEHA